MASPQFSWRIKTSLRKCLQYYNESLIILYNKLVEREANVEGTEKFLWIT